MYRGYNALEKTKNKINKIFKEEITIMNDIYKLIGIVCMPTENHFCASIFNYNNDINNKGN